MAVGEKSQEVTRGSYRNDVSPLTQGFRYRAACDFVTMATRVGHCHRLRGSASPMSTATHHSYGSPRLSDFFPLSDLGVRPLNGHSRKMTQTTCFYAKMYLLQ